MDSNERQAKRMRVLGFDSINNGEVISDRVSHNMMLASLEKQLETVDNVEEEEDLDGVAAKEEKIKNVMKSLEMEIALPECMLPPGVCCSSYCLQSDSAFSMSVSSSRVSDPYHLNLGTTCRCILSEAEYELEKHLDFVVSDGQHGLTPGSPLYGSESGGSDLFEGSLGIGGSLAMKEWLDLEVWGVL